MRRKNPAEDRKERMETKKRDRKDVRKIDDMQKGEMKEGQRFKKIADLNKKLAKQNEKMSSEHKKMTKTTKRGR